MLTKGAIGNLVNRYKAVLKKCNLINTFGSLAVTSMLVLGGAGVAEASYSFDNSWAVSKYKVFDGQQGAVTDAISQSRVLGGSYPHQDNCTVAPNISSDLTIDTNSSFDLVVGGHYLQSIIDAPDDVINVTTTSTSLTIKNGNFTKNVVGGNGGTDNQSVIYNNEKAKLTISGGSFGTTNLAGQNCPDLLVIGGDLIKSGTGNHIIFSKSTLGETETTISGEAVFNSAIISGSAAIQFYAQIAR